MHSFLGNIGRVIAALWQIGRAHAPGLMGRAWDFYARWTRRLVRLALVVVIGQPIAVILVSLTGVHEATVLMALTPIIALLFLMIVASMPRHQDELAAGLAIGAGLATWDRTTRILSHIYRGLVLFLLLDLAFGLYFSLLPVENDRRLTLWIVPLGITFLLSVALMKPERRQKLIDVSVGFLLVASAAMLFIVFPIVLLNGGWGETKSDIAKALKDDAKAAPVAPPSVVAGSGKMSCTATNCTTRVILPADGSKSAAVNIDAVVPDTWNYNFDGPSGTMVYWEDFGDAAPIAVGFDLGDGRRGWGSRDGLVQFSAPAGTGGEVVIRSHPPR